MQSDNHAEILCMQAILDDVSPVERMRLSAELVSLSKQLADEKDKSSPAKMVLMSLSSKVVQIRAKLGTLSKATVSAPVELPKANAETYEYDDYGILKGEGKVARERMNAEVVGIVDQVRNGALRPENITPEQKQLLKKYSGKGGLTENSQYEYFTPPHIAAGAWDILAEYGFRNGNVLEPSTGAGVFSETKPKGVVVSGAEIDPVGATVNQILHPEDKIENTAFETLVTHTEDNTFDACIGNVPFGVRGKTAHIDKEFKSEKGIQYYFLERVIDKVKPGGLIVLVVPTCVIKETKRRKWRASISMKAEFLGAHKLPSNTFSQQGTSAVTDIIVMRKHPADILAKIDSLSAETLKAANVLWEEFLAGNYWKGEGKKFIKGDYVIAGKDAFRPGAESVVADKNMTNESLKKSLAVRFDSRIDWDMLESAEPAQTVYADGDVKFINGKQMVMAEGKWIAAESSAASTTALDPAKFGAGSVEELRGILATPDGMLSLTAKQAYKAYKAYPALFNDQQKMAVEFAMSQPKEKFYDFAYRGSLLGSMVGNYAVGADATDRDRVIALLKAEFERNGHPSTAKGMMIDGEMSRAFGQYLSAVNEKGQISSIVAGEATEVKGYTEDDILSIVMMLERTRSNPIELADVVALYKGARKLESFGDIADVEGVAITPSGFISTVRAYCSGDAYDKIDALRGAMVEEKDARVKGHYNNLIAILAGRVKSTPIESISFGLRDKWISPAYREEFLRSSGWRMRFDPAAEVEDESGEQTKTPTLGAWKFEGDKKNRTKNESVDFAAQLEHYLNGKAIGFGVVGRGGSEEEKKEDKRERKIEYQEKVNALEEQFKFYMQSHPDSAELQSTYNMMFNRHIEQEYDNAPLGLKGVSAGVVLHDYQNAGVRRLVDKGSGILGYDVGLGKSFTSLAYSVYDRQMGNSKKHCTVVPKSVLGNWYNESKRLLGNHDNVLFVGFEPKRNKDGSIVQEPVMDENNKQKVNAHTGELEWQDVLIPDSSAQTFEKMHRIPMMDSGLVIMTQEKFKMIPVKPDTIAGYGEKWVERNMIAKANLEKLTTGNGKDADGGAERKSFADEKKRAALENKLYNEGTEKKDQFPFYEDMGFDRVIVDEAHQFKGSFSFSDMDKLAYLSKPQTSQRAQDMAIKLSHLRDNNGGKGAILLTATPVANSPIEIYNMLQLVLSTEEMDKYGIFTPDDFVRFFGTIETVDKLSITGTIEQRDGLKGFRNLNVLRQLFARFADMKDATDVDPDGTRLKLPDAADVKCQCDMTGEQSIAYTELRAEAKLSGNPAKVKSGEARPMFAVIRDMDRVTTDIDLYNKTMTFVFKSSDEGNLKHLIDALPDSLEFVAKEDEFGELVKTKKKADSKKADSDAVILVKKQTNFTQKGDTLVYVVPEEYEAEVVKRLPKFGIDFVSHPLTPKYAKLIENIKAELASGGKQLVFTEEKSQHAKLERILVNNLPLDEESIGVINAETAGGEKLQEIVDAYTRGDYEIIICNKKAEVGVNLQKGTSAVHHMTLPWTPASIQQRNGRAVRQGNTIAGGVRIYYYQGKDTFDDYRLDLLNKKAGWIGALLDVKNEDDEFDNGDATSDLDQAALLSDNPEEFLATIAAGQAKKEAEAKERRIKATKSTLMQLISSKRFIAEYADRKAKAKSDLDHEKALAVKSLQKAIEENGEDHVIAQRRKASLSVIERKLGKFDGEWEARLASAKLAEKQQKSALKAAESRGELPYDAKIIDAESALISRSGAVVYVGGIYDVTAMDKRNAKSMVVKVLALNEAEKSVDVEVLVGWAYRTSFGIDELFVDGTFEAHYDESELRLIKALAEPIPYDKLADTLTKDVYLTHADKVAVDGYGLYRGSDNSLVTYSYKPKDATLVYPDVSDKALLKEVAGMYADYLQLDVRNRSYGVERGMNTAMAALFGGESWRDNLGEYIATAKPEDVVAKATELLSKVLPVVEPDSEAGVEAVIESLRDQWATDVKSGVEQWMEDAGYINKPEAAQITSGVLADTGRKYIALLSEIKNASALKAAKAQEEALKQDPRYREIHAGDVERFAAMGIAASYNLKDVGYKRAFEWLFLKDSNGKNGRLFATKEILKNRLKATWFPAKAVGYGDAKFGDSWIVPSSTNIAELLDILE